MAFAHLGRARHGPLEGLLRGLGVLAKPDRDIGQKAEAARLGVEPGAVAGDHAAALKLLHPAQAGRGRQADARRKVEVGKAPLAGERLQYLFGD